MAGRTRSLKEERRMADAAEARGAGAADDVVVAPKKKKAVKDPKKKAAPRAKRTKSKTLVRKRLLWGVYSNSMKEEGRYAYADREAADARCEELSLKNKKPYFVQPIKEPLSVAAPEKEKEKAAVAVAKVVEAPEEDDEAEE